MKRTLMYRNQELLDFEVDTAAHKVHVLDAPERGDESLIKLGIDANRLEEFTDDFIKKRCITSARKHFSELLDSFGASSALELVFRGHGASLTDHFWYRAPGSTERWEDINFFDNEWDETFSQAVFEGDYSKLASCSPDIPDLTTRGTLEKAWEKNDRGIFLVKETLLKSGADLEGAVLGAKLCMLLYGEDAYQPLYAEERCGRRFSVSPLMISRDEELVQGWRLFALSGLQMEPSGDMMGPTTPEMMMDVFSRAGISNPSADTAKIFTFKDLALLADFHTGNYGLVCNVHTGERRVAPPFDYDRSFGFPNEDYPIDVMCSKPTLAIMTCAYSFTDLDPSWDMTWYKPEVLEGFEEHIIDAYDSHPELPSNFAALVAHLFVTQRDYVNGIARS